MKRLVPFFLSLAIALDASYCAQQLALTDVRDSMEEMFSLHVKTHDMTPSLVKRAMHNFIEQFDPQKMYLTQSEVKPFLNLSSFMIEQVIDHYYTDEFPEFEMLNHRMIKGISRAKVWRRQFYEAFMKEADALCLKVPKEKQSHYAETADELKLRFQSELFRLFLLENRNHERNYWTTARRQTACVLFERRFEQYERKYLSLLEGQEGDFAIHLLKAISKGLDAHTAYFTPLEAYEMRSSLEKQFEGVGVVLREGLDGIEIVALIEGGPAAKSGQICVGDLLVEVDGRLVMGSSYQEVLLLLQGNGRKEVRLALKRKTGHEEECFFQTSLKREKIAMQEQRVSYSTEPFGQGVIGKITVPSFYEGTSFSACDADIREALRQMKKEGQLLGVVIDLRENLGGFLSQAVKVASTFMTSGVVVVSKYAQGEVQYLRNVDPRVHYQGPLVILTSKMSASAAEIVAQALQDYGIALVVGDARTYGKGSIQYQTLTDPTAHAYFKVTVGKYYTVSGRSTQIEGVKADIVIPTHYTPYLIGEKYLQYALKNDQIAPAYSDTLIDVEGSTHRWFQHNYLPFLQKKESVWTEMLPLLKKNSDYRITHSLEYQKFIKDPDKMNPLWDLPLEEAVNIIKDMQAIVHEKQTDHFRS
ncbi:MAG: S41 family peptidase [Candidatus Rhabdochlamydia sp.]